MSATGKEKKTVNVRMTKSYPHVRQPDLVLLGIVRRSIVNKQKNISNLLTVLCVDLQHVLLEYVITARLSCRSDHKRFQLFGSYCIEKEMSMHIIQNGMYSIKVQL